MTIIFTKNQVMVVLQAVMEKMIRSGDPFREGDLLKAGVKLADAQRISLFDLIEKESELSEGVAL